MCEHIFSAFPGLTFMLRSGHTPDPGLVTDMTGGCQVNFGETKAAAMPVGAKRWWCGPSSYWAVKGRGLRTGPITPLYHSLVDVDHTEALENAQSALSCSKARAEIWTEHSCHFTSTKSFLHVAGSNLLHITP